MPISLEVVPISGAGTSVSGPIIGKISYVYLLVTRSSSLGDSFFGSQITPPFAPPNGKSTTLHFNVISIERAVITSTVTSGLYRMPPLVG